LPLADVADLTAGGTSPSLKLTYQRGAYNLHFADLKRPSGTDGPQNAVADASGPVTYQPSTLDAPPVLTYQVDGDAAEDGGFLATWNAFIGEQFMLNNMISSNEHKNKRELPPHPPVKPVFGDEDVARKQDGGGLTVVEGMCGWEYPVLRGDDQPRTPPSYGSFLSTLHFVPVSVYFC
jgi:hypothetical protein